MRPKLKLKNRKFGRLKVLSCLGRINKYTIWKCRCDCGNITKIRTANLVGNYTKSCGCLQKQSSFKNRFKISATKSRNRMERLLDNTPEAYYWMGYLLADGYFNHKSSSIAVCSAIKDKEHLKQFADFVGCELKSYISESGYSQGIRYYRILIQNKIYFNDIVKKFDIRMRKTYNAPEKLNIKSNDLFISMFVGFVDGDGYIKDDSIRIENHISWRDVLTLFKRRIYKIFKIKRDIRDKNQDAVVGKRGYCRINICSHECMISLKTNIEKLQLPILNRKWK